jgi:hypothetical protein
MPKRKLEAALSAIDWDANMADFLSDPRSDALVQACLRLATWAYQIEEADAGNPAISFVREMQISGQHVAVLLSLGLYKPAASAMRAALESALYYTYFRSHLIELATLKRDAEYYIDKREILEYHVQHTDRFKQNSNVLNLNGPLKAWYSNISAVVHGQIPGSWTSYTSIRDIKHNQDSLKIAVDTFTECENLIKKLFLSTIAPALWSYFSSPAKQQFLLGLPGNQKSALMLDKA